jgi:hypothetical protein
MMGGNMLAATVAGSHTKNWRWPALAVALCTTALLLLLLGAHPDSASAKSEIFRFESNPSTTQAGGHPDVFTTFELGGRDNQEKVPCECNDPKDVIQHIPAGVSANPHVVSECSIARFILKECPADSQAGVVVFKIFAWAVTPLYRIPVQKGQAGLFAFTVIGGGPIYISFTARTGSDYGLDAKTLGMSHISTLLNYGPIFWGVPGDHFNDPMRFAPGEEAFICTDNPSQAMEGHDSDGLKNMCPAIAGKSIPSSLPIAPLMQNPTTCSGPLVSELETVGYDLERDRAEAPWPATTGCDKLKFAPSLAANPTTTNTDTASGLEVVLSVPQFQDPNVPSPSQLKANTVTLPEGFSINPNAADGKTSCTDEQSRVGTEEEAQCPEESKVGTVTIDSSALPAPIHGFIYLGEPKPGEPYRLVVTANGFGTAVKLLGTAHTNPGTGQLVTTFENLPQTPFQEFVLHFFGSERGLLATPTQCGTYPVKSTFAPWASELSEQTQTQFFVLDHGPNGAPCPAAVRDFSPKFVAGVKDNTGGAHSPFGLRISREDGQQNLSGLTLETPPGLLAKLKGVPYCPQAAIDLVSAPGHSGRTELAAPACPAASQVGVTTTGLGAGTHPVHIPGRVYLAGPYKGAPLSLLVVVPAVTGPYDFGNVAVRVALNVDPVTAEITAGADPLPQIFAGVPLRMRMIQIELDRPDFMVNPTNCEPYSVDAAFGGDQGGAARASAPFQVGNCRSLAFKPKLSLSFGGGVHRLGHPAIEATFRAEPGEANTKRVTVTLPPSEILDNAHIDTVCTRPQFRSDSCPGGSEIGAARVTTPLLDDPLSGNVYLRSNPSGDLPNVVVDLEGQIDVELVGHIGSSKRGGLRTTFVAPDAAVSSLVLRLKGGKKGLLRNTRDLCGGPGRAKTKMTGQNGWVDNGKARLKVACGSSKKQRRHHRRAVR